MREIVILGEELPTTGANVMLFVYLFAAGLILTFCGYLLKLTSSKERS